NPLTDEIQKEITELSINSDKKIIALLPGSRKREIEMNLPIMLSVIPHFLDYQFVIASTDNMYELCSKISKNKDVKIIKEQTYSVLKSSEIALVTSGTATLETAFFNIPQLVCYKTDFLTYNLAKLFVKLKWISLVNIIMDKEVISEFIQDRMTNKNLKKEMDYLLSKKGRTKLLSEYKELSLVLKSERVSEKISNFILQNI
ncbi:MAG: lipid-A-disaccharide synthase, partial [Flavobacteriales bacterium]|nr:lipid-A-disaccharide synthase [Flavobacteriales bacterium]